MSKNLIYSRRPDFLPMTPMEIVRRTAENSNGFSLPGWEPARLAELEHVLELYKNVDEDKLFENQQLFKTPIVRNGRKATVGYQPEIWKDWE